MQLVETIEALRQQRRVAGHNKVVGVVPTMGDVHAGHLRLIEACQENCSFVIATVFVNPLQFGPKEDFADYPRALARDADELKKLGVDVLFAPPIEEMYPGGQLAHTTVTVPELSKDLCGAMRPGHFDGVTTVVAKLFQITQPDFAYFGEKDWQQLAIIKRMVVQLNMPLEVVGVPTRREVDGLAMSSRNRYLTSEQRELAPNLFLSLRSVAHHLHEGATNYTELEQAATNQLRELDFKPDYISIREPDSLLPPTAESRSLRVFGAARLGRTRLIDNIGIER